MEQAKTVLFTIITSLVDDPAAVTIESSTDEMGVLFELQVGQQDMGKIIGRQGNTAKSIRSVLRAVGMKAGARINIKILEPIGADNLG